jgi:hypothetical protein
MRLRVIAILGVTFLFALPSVAGAYTVEGPSGGATETTKLEGERAAKEQSEANERAAKAAGEKKAAEERQQHEAAEHQHQEEEHAEAQRGKEAAEQKSQEVTAPQCVVPSLKGDSLGRATTTLRKAHCKLGHVSGSRKGGAAFVVVAQKLKPGVRSAAGTVVGVTLGSGRRARR